MAMGTQRIIPGRYWNYQGVAGIAIVAVVTEGIDWAAYIGVDDGWSTRACHETAAEYGEKLTEADARHFFPDIEESYRP